jgi:hypothetical protein
VEELLTRGDASNGHDGREQLGRMHCVSTNTDVSDQTRHMCRIVNEAMVRMRRVDREGWSEDSSVADF